MIRRNAYFVFCLGIYCERLLPADLVWDLLGDLVGAFWSQRGVQAKADRQADTSLSMSKFGRE